jgi:hypothetical protein
MRLAAALAPEATVPEDELPELLLRLLEETNFEQPRLATRVIRATLTRGERCMLRSLESGFWAE